MMRDSVCDAWCPHPCCPVAASASASASPHLTRRCHPARVLRRGLQLHMQGFVELRHMSVHVCACVCMWMSVC